jgi:PEP-CTERM motif-containing protein
MRRTTKLQVASSIAAATLFAFAGGSASAATVFHVGADSSGGPGTDPNLIASNSQFFIADVSAGQETVSPLTIYLATPDGAAAPTFSSIVYNSLGSSPTRTFGSVSQLPGDFTTGDLYTFVGCSACNNSLNFTNISLAEAPLFGGVAPTAYDVYQVTVQTSFVGGDFLQVNGAFGLGTIIAPLAFNDKGNVIDTSWTNTGLVSMRAVPEPSTWAMMILGFVGVGFMAYRRHGTVRLV